MQVEIVTIGDEVLSGRTLDTNFAFLARAFEEGSVRVGWHSTVGDSAERIAEGLGRALARADAVITTGGLRPPPEAIAPHAGAIPAVRPLPPHANPLEPIRARLAERARNGPAPGCPPARV